MHRYFLEWEAAGFFEKLWRKGLAEYDELEGIAWAWQSIDGSNIKAPMAKVVEYFIPTRWLLVVWMKCPCIFL